MSSTKPVVAIAGATGRLGVHMTKAFLEPETLSRFGAVILLSRQASSPQLEEWKKQGAKIAVYSEDDIAKSLEGVDVLVNAIGSKGHAFKDLLVRALAAPNSSVKLYLPSEFGVDHTIHTFPNNEWDYKKAHRTLATTLLAPDTASNRPLERQVKVCRVFTGLFLEHSVGPWFGYDTANRKYGAVGNKHAKTSFTGLDDVGRAVAALAAMDPQNLPDDIRISGDAQSMSVVADVMGKAGAGNIEVVVIDYDDYKKKTIEEGTPNPAKYLRFLMGDGSIDHSDTGLGNHNELINPGEKSWRWKTMEEYAKETGGKPWVD